MRGKDAVLRKAPAYSFGGKDGTHLLGELSPGPGHFTPKHIGPHHPAPSFHGTAGPQPRNSIPGPGAFAVERADKICKPTSPSVSIGLRWQEPGGKEVRPGPADYNSSLPGSSAQAGVSLKFKHEGALASKEAAALFGSPGPGAYSAGSGRPGDRGPAFTIGQRGLHYKQQGDSPGPGAYEHE
ncbi:hypothetical protein N2152v2_009851 [Parachlorella kessleri]